MMFRDGQWAVGPPHRRLNSLPLAVAAGAVGWVSQTDSRCGAGGLDPSRDLGQQAPVGTKPDQPTWSL